MSHTPGATDRYYRLLVEQLRDYAVLLLDPAGRIVGWNEGARLIFGYTAGQAQGLAAEVIFTPEDRDRRVPEQELATALRDGRADDERWHVRRDGSLFFASGVVLPLRDESGGELLGFTKVLRDLTERKLAEQRLATEVAVARVLAEQPTLEGALPRVLEAVCRTGDWDWAAAWTVEEGRGVLRCAETWHRPELPASEFDRISRGMTLPPAVGLPGRVWASGRPAWVTDVLSDDNFPRRMAAERLGLHGALCFPVAAGGAVLGAIEFLTRQVRPPDEPLLAMMQVVGAQVGLFIARRSSERLLAGSEARKAAVLEASLDCIVSMDAAGRVVEWNAAAERTFGYARDEALGREMAELIIPPALRDAHRAGLTRYLATGAGAVIGRRIEISGVRRDGREFPVELTITRVPLPGPPTFTGHLRDITDRLLAQRERERLLESERTARGEAERASRMKDEFLATLSHELRTPLNAILGWSQILANGSRNDDDLAEGLRTIERNARAQTQIIEDLLDMSRIISGKVRLELRRVDLRTVLAGTLETVRPAAAAKGIALRPALDPLPVEVGGDADRLQQVFWNLLTNAIKFTPRGGHVAVAVRRADSHAEVVVSDSGVGIRPDFLPYAFDRFRQSDASASRRHGGLGLGLSLVKQLVELHGGTVRAESAGEGRGATFVVALPLPEGTLPDEPAEAPRPKRAAAASAAMPRCDDLRGVRVLVVDDEPDALGLVRRLLEDCGAVVAAAASAEEALQIVRRQRPDVLVSDVGMPDGDGYELIRRVRQLSPAEGGDTPAAALTAYAHPEDVRRALAAGFQSHVPKPVEAAALVAAVARLASRGAVAEPP